MKIYQLVRANGGKEYQAHSPSHAPGGDLPGNARPVESGAKGPRLGIWEASHLRSVDGAFGKRHAIRRLTPSKITDAGALKAGSRGHPAGSLNATSRLKAGCGQNCPPSNLCRIASRLENYAALGWEPAPQFVAAREVFRPRIARLYDLRILCNRVHQRCVGGISRAGSCNGCFRPDP